MSTEWTTYDRRNSPRAKPKDLIDIPLEYLSHEMLPDRFNPGKKVAIIRVRLVDENTLYGILPVSFFHSSTIVHDFLNEHTSELNGKRLVFRLEYNDDARAKWSVEYRVEDNDTPF